MNQLVQELSAGSLSSLTHSSLPNILAIVPMVSFSEEDLCEQDFEAANEELQ
jgi:hypothetical protein